VTRFDPEVMREIVNDMFTPLVVRQHGVQGGERLRDLLAALRRIYRFRSAERFSAGLTVFASVDGTAVEFQGQPGQALEPDQVGRQLADGGVLQVLPSGGLLAWQRTPDTRELLELGGRAVVYVWRQEGESFATEHGFKQVLNPNGHPSALAPPTFFLLADALNYYEGHLARHSTCHILQDAWYDDHRLLLANKCIPGSFRLRRFIA